MIVGCGYVGTALGQSLVQAGHRVWGIRRNPDKLPSDIQPIECDLANLANLRFDFSPEYIFYMPSAGQYDVATYRATYLDGAKNLLACLALNRSQCQRLFYISSTSVYSQDDGSWVDESTPAEPSSSHAELLLAGEQVFLQSDYPATVIRFGGIYGPNRTHFIDKVRIGEMLQSPKPLYTNRIHRDDCVGLLQFLLTYPQPESLYLGVDSEPALKNTVILWLAQQMGLVIPPIAKETSRPEQRMRGNKRCSNRRILAAGYQFKHPSFREGYLAT